MLASQALMQGNGTRASGKAADKAKMIQTARDFEAIFVQQIFKEMRQAVPDGGLLPKGQSEEIFQDLQDREAARQLTRQGGIGIAAMLVEQMQKAED